MSQKSNITALWFIPLVAFVLAGVLTVIGVVGWRLLRPGVSDQPPATETSSSVSSSTRPVRQNVPSRQRESTVKVPQNLSVGAAVPAQPFASKEGVSFSPVRARFERAFVQCLKRDSYPCTWQDTQDGVLKQFGVTKKEGIIVRNIYQLDNTPLSQTAISQQGEVLLYRQNNTTWYFDKVGRVRHIAVGVTPQAGADDPHDSYFYDVNGQLNSCVCADNTTQCCARAPQLQATAHTYCGLFAPDGELCPLSL